jgi:hypothetical protein
VTATEFPAGLLETCDILEDAGLELVGACGGDDEVDLAVEFVGRNLSYVISVFGNALWLFVSEMDTAGDLTALVSTNVDADGWACVRRAILDCEEVT